MNILNDKTREQISIVNQKEIAKEHKYLGTLRPKKGQHVYELDIAAKKIRIAEFEKQTITYEQGVKGKIRRDIIVKPGCLYTVALNEKNADQKFGLMLLKILEDKKARKAKKANGK